METFAALDLRVHPKIHFPGIFAILALALAGCSKSKEPQPVPDAGTAQAIVEDAPDQPEEPDAGEPEPDPVETGIIGTGEEAVVKAIGRARKSVDISLARQAASNRARHEIANLLKQKGYTFDPPGILQGVTIERIWTKGRFVYALGVLPLSNLQEKPNEMNDPGSAPSNPPEGHEPGKTDPPQGGNVP